MAGLVEAHAVVARLVVGHAQRQPLLLRLLPRLLARQLGRRRKPLRGIAASKRSPTRRDPTTHERSETAVVTPQRNLGAVKRRSIPLPRSHTPQNVDRGFALCTNRAESPWSKPPASRQRATVAAEAVLSVASEYTTASESSFPTTKKLLLLSMPQKKRDVLPPARGGQQLEPCSVGVSECRAVSGHSTLLSQLPPPG